MLSINLESCSLSNFKSKFPIKTDHQFTLKLFKLAIIELLLFFVTQIKNANNSSVNVLYNRSNCLENMQKLLIFSVHLCILNF